jgi:Arc/MetJ family transcription regulator
VAVRRAEPLNSGEYVHSPTAVTVSAASSFVFCVAVSLVSASSSSRPGAPDRDWLYRRSLIYIIVGRGYLSNSVYQTKVVVKVAKTLLDLDEALLAEAAATLGTKTKKETVTLALRKVSEDARARRASALEDLLTVADGGGFDYDRLADLDQ